LPTQMAMLNQQVGAHTRPRSGYAWSAALRRASIRRERLPTSTRSMRCAVPRVFIFCIFDDRARLNAAHYGRSAIRNDHALIRRGGEIVRDGAGIRPGCYSQGPQCRPPVYYARQADTKGPKLGLSIYPHQLSHPPYFIARAQSARVNGAIDAGRRVPRTIPGD